MRSPIQSFHETFESWGRPLPDLRLRDSLLIRRPRHKNIEPQDTESQSQNSASKIASGNSCRSRSDSIFQNHEKVLLPEAGGTNYHNREQLKQTYVRGAQLHKGEISLAEYQAQERIDSESKTSENPTLSPVTDGPCESLSEVNQSSLEEIEPVKLVRESPGSDQSISNTSHDDVPVGARSTSCPSAGTSGEPFRITRASCALDTATITDSEETWSTLSVIEDEIDHSTERQGIGSDTVESFQQSRPFPLRVSSLVYSKLHEAATKALQRSRITTTTPRAFISEIDSAPNLVEAGIESYVLEDYLPKETTQIEVSRSRAQSSEEAAPGAHQQDLPLAGQLSKHTDKMLGFMSPARAGPKPRGKRTTEQTSLLRFREEPHDMAVKPLPLQIEKKTFGNDNNDRKLKGMRSIWRLGAYSSVSEQNSEHQKDALCAVEDRNDGQPSSGKLVNGTPLFEKETYDLLNTINLARIDREIHPLRYCDRLCAEAQDIATAHDLQSDSATLYGATKDFSSGSAIWFREETSTAVLLGPANFVALTTAELWIRGQDPRHEQRNHQRVVDDGIHLEHCACYNHKMYVALADEVWETIGMARTETDERWVVVLGDQSASEELSYSHPVRKRTAAVERKPVPTNPHAAEYGVMSPYDWDSEEDVELDAVAGSSRYD